MRKVLPIIISFLLLTFSMTQLAIAQKQNVITNQTTEALYVVYSTKADSFGDPFENGKLQNPKWKWRNEPLDWDVGETRKNHLYIDGEPNRNLWVDDQTHFLYQEIDTDNFDVETHFSAKWNTSSGVNGIMVKSPKDNNWVTIKFWSRDAGSKGLIQYQTRQAGMGPGPHDIQWRFGNWGDIELSLRLKKQGNTYTAWYKAAQDTNWVDIGQGNFNLTPPLQLGIYAGVAANTGKLEVEYEYFKDNLNPVEPVGKTTTTFGADAPIPAGYRTHGWKKIPPGQQKTFWAYDPHKIYFQIWKGGDRIKPQRATQTFAFWINRNANFNIVTRQEINASITRGQLLYSSHDTSLLTHSDGFMRYNNGSRITVTNAWVDVDVVDDGNDGAGEIPSANFTVANDSHMKVSVIYGYWDADQNLFRIRGYYHIQPNGSKSLWVPAKVTKVFARIWTQTDVVKHDRDNYSSSRVHPKRSFDVFYKQDGTIVQSNVPHNELVTRSDFYQYDNNTTFRYKGGEDDTPVTIPDPGLRSTIEKELGKAEGATITVADMRTLTEFYIDDTEDLTGLEFATNLITLEIIETYSGLDLAPIAGLENLTKLRLNGNYISDISPLKNLKNLTDLELGYNDEISDISPLANLKNLTDLYLAQNHISDISPLKNLKNLTYLNLNTNDIVDVSPLANLKNLTYLNLGCPPFPEYGGTPQISDISPLANLKNLTKLYLGGNQISDISPLANLRNLTHLDLSGDIWLFLEPDDLNSAELISDVSPLANLKNLTYLNLSNNQISDFSPIAGLIPNLETYENGGQRVEVMDPNTPVNIPDSNLRAAIEEALGKTQGSAITQADMETLTELNASDKDISSIIGLEFAINLTELDLSNNAISDISRLSGLTNLTELGLSNNEIADLTPLKGLKKLTRLNLNANVISELSPLAALKHLTKLNLGYNRISDLSPLTQLKQLTWLYLSYNQIADVSPLAQLTNLKALYLSYNKIADFSAIAGLVKQLERYDNAHQTPGGLNAPVNIPDLNLRAAIEEALSKASGTMITQADMLKLIRLGASDADIEDLTGLEFATNLTELYLSTNQITDISPLAGLTNLITLQFSDQYIDSGNQITDISPLVNLTRLRSLWLAYNEIVDISPLAKLTQLKVLMLSSNQISNISPLAKLTQLTTLSLSYNEIVDISPLAKLTQLTALWFESSAVTDISPLANLTRLRSLWLAYNEITDISPLTKLTQLEKLFLRQNHISDVSPLVGLNKLKYLDLSENRISDFSPIAGLIPNLENYINSPQLKSLIPHAVEVSGPTTVTSVVRDYGFTATVKNASNQGLRNVEVTINGGQTVRTNSSGQAKFNLSFPSVGTHDMTVRVRDEETGTDFQRHFPDRVKVPKPYSIELLKDIRVIAVGRLYTAIFVVKSAAGETLEGFEVRMNVGQWAFEMIQTGVQMYIPREAINWETYWTEDAEYFMYYDPNDLGVVEFYRVVAENTNDLETLNNLNAGVKEVDFFGWRVSSGASDKLNTALTNNEGIARCHQRLLSNGFYGVSATVLLNGQELLTRSFSDSEQSNRIFINPAWSLDDAALRNISAPFYVGAFIFPTWFRIEKEDDRRFHKRGGQYVFDWPDSDPEFPAAPVEPPSYRVEVVTPKGACHPSVPTPEVYDLAEHFNFANVQFSPVFSLHSEDMSEESEPSLDETPPNTTTSLDRRVRWTPETTITMDIGVTVITVRFLDGTEEQIRILKDAFEEWESVGAMVFFRFVDTGPADIRVTFDEAKLDKALKKRIAEKGVIGNADLGANGWYTTTLREIRESKRTGFWDALGAALFDWAGYETEVSKTQAEKWAEFEKRQDERTLWVSAKLAPIDFYNCAQHEIGHTLGFYHVEQISEKKVNLGETAHVDEHSIMTTEVTVGLGEKKSLSGGDKKALKNGYTPRPSEGWKPYHVTGRISIHGKDDEWSGFHEYFDDTSPYVDIYVHRDHDTYEFFPFQHFKWGGEIRVEVDIGAKADDNDGSVMMAAKVRLYEGDDVDTSQLEDEKTEYFSPGQAHTIRVENHGQGDYAEVTFDFRYPAPQVTAVGLAPSSVSAPDDSASVDVNGDGQVDAADLVLVSNHIGQSAPETPPVDVNGDGIVTIADLVQVAQYLGQSTTASAPVSVVVPNGLTYETVEAWIHQARLEDDGSRVFHQGIAKLEYLLTLIIPEKTALLPNYPNPFNPETWIPYHLAEPAHVVLTLYSVDGKAVRRLDLGHQAAGYYQSRSRAAYWDGRNAVGERVASGLYFYTLTAGDFSATRKMLIMK